jgi:hypothetical protein
MGWRTIVTYAQSPGTTVSIPKGMWPTSARYPSRSSEGRAKRSLADRSYAIPSNWYTASSPYSLMMTPRSVIPAVFGTWRNTTGRDPSRRRRAPGFTQGADSARPSA